MESTFLFVNPSLLHGAARTLDLWGQLNQYNISETPAEADYWAMVADSCAVSRDFEVAIASVWTDVQRLQEEHQYNVLDAETVE